MFILDILFVFIGFLGFFNFCLIIPDIIDYYHLKSDLSNEELSIFNKVREEVEVNKLTLYSSALSNHSKEQIIVHVPYNLLLCKPEKRVENREMCITPTLLTIKHGEEIVGKKPVTRKLFVKLKNYCKMRKEVLELENQRQKNIKDNELNKNADKIFNNDLWDRI